eukprot:2685647-Amphidinium_carterae.1
MSGDAVATDQNSLSMNASGMRVLLAKGSPTIQTARPYPNSDNRGITLDTDEIFSLYRWFRFPRRYLRGGTFVAAAVLEEQFAS